MAENKKAFILYTDQKELFDQLSNDKAGELIKHIFKYVTDENPINSDALINMAFTSIKQQLKRDLKKWEKRAESSRLNGLKGGRPKAKLTQETQQVISEPRKPVKDTVTVNVKVKDIKYRKEEFKNSLKPFLKGYSKEVLNNFYEDWTEIKGNGKKMKFEYSKNQPFDYENLLAECNKDKDIYRKFAHLKLSNIDFNKLNKIYPKEQIDDILDSIENYKKNKNYNSLYLTSLKWLKKEGVKKQIKKITFTNPYDNIKTQNI